MKKRIALICAVIMVMMSFAESVGAINVIMNSSFIKFPDQEPVILDGVTLVPIRPIAEALGLEVTWDDPTDTVTLKKNNFFIEMVIGSKTAKTSAGTKTLDVAPTIINKRTMVPLRFIAEELGLTVSWNQEYQRVVIVGQVDTQTVVKLPVEEATDVVEDKKEAVSEKTEKTEENVDVAEPSEEESDFVDDTSFTTFEASSSSISIEIPLSFFPDDTDSEESFAYRTLDATDSQHTYNWDIVTRYESFADEAGTSGITVIVQENSPYEGEEYDISNMNQSYPTAPERPERPEWPDIDMGLFIGEYTLAIVKQVYIDMGVEIPENLGDMSEEEIVADLGLDSSEDYSAQMELAMGNADFSEVTGYDEYMAYQEDQQNYNEEMTVYWEDYAIYSQEVAEINAVKTYAIRNFSSLVDKASAEDWAILFDATLNTDPEVRYEGVEILDFNGKKIVHATLYAEDPDDEQGVYSYYYYIDGDCVITIYGGTLFGSEPSSEAADALANMNIQ